MSLFTRDGFIGFVDALPGTSRVDQWETCCAKVGGKVFALLSDDGQRLTFKVPEESFEILTALDGIMQAAYFAKRKWVTVMADAPLSTDDLAYYLNQSYAQVAQGLTKKLRSELGIVVAT